jgi:hypothetical protein
MHHHTTIIDIAVTLLKLFQWPDGETSQFGVAKSHCDKFVPASSLAFVPASSLACERFKAFKLNFSGFQRNDRQMDMRHLSFESYGILYTAESIFAV